MATGKKTLANVTISKGDTWILVTNEARYIQNIDDEPIRFAFSDVLPTIKKEDGHVMRMHDDYVNDAGDFFWVHQSPSKEHRLALTEFGTP